MASSLPTYEQFLEQLEPILIISDEKECNGNLSIFFKSAVDYLKTQEETYHTSSVLALKLLNSNLFIKNFRLCLGKIFGIMSIFSESVAGDCAEEALILKEILSIVVLLLFKLSTDETGPSPLSYAISQDEIFDTLRDLSFVEVLSRFIAGHVKGSDGSRSAFVVLSFNCNIFFQYLYHIILLSDEEFSSLTNCSLISVVIDDLLSNDNFNNYELAGQNFEDVSKLIAYEEFKLLLLINEQYMMRSISSRAVEDRVSQNKVIEGLLETRKEFVNGVCGFINLLVYHLNREESHIIRIQMLKFVYLILTSPKSCKSAYLNDLKILTDIIIRELNDLDYSSNMSSQENRLLALTYLKTLYPLLTLSQLNEISPKYKSAQLRDVLSNVISNCDVTPIDSSTTECIENDSIFNVRSIVKSASKCLTIPWLKAPKNKLPVRSSNRPNSSSDSLGSASSLSSRVNSLRLDKLDSNNSGESFPISRIASVRASSVSDYNKRTHKIADLDNEPMNIFEASNSNVFRSNVDSVQSTTTRSPFSQDETCPSSDQTLGLLDLPKRYYKKKSLPPLPQEAQRDHSSAQEISVLQEKARRKKAPPPPPPPSRKRR